MGTQEADLARCLEASDAVLTTRLGGFASGPSQPTDGAKGLHVLLLEARQALLLCRFSSSGLGGSSSLFAANKFGEGAVGLRARVKDSRDGVQVRVKESGKTQGEFELVGGEMAERERIEALKCFSGLPTPALRQAQQKFCAVLEAVVSVVNAQLAASRYGEEYTHKYMQLHSPEGNDGVGTKTPARLNGKEQARATAKDSDGSPGRGRPSPVLAGRASRAQEQDAKKT